MDAKTIAVTFALVIAGGLAGAFLGVLVIEGSEEIFAESGSFDESSIVTAQAVGMVLLLGAALTMAGRSAWLHRVRPLAFYVTIAVAAPIGLTMA